jgi:hypothetical protein
MDLSKIIDYGKSLGFEGGELHKFVENERSRFEKKEQPKIAREEKFETERLHHEQAIKDREFRLRERELGIKEQELTMQREQEERSEHDHSSHHTPNRMLPKLPYFDETKDNMDSYLLRFERYAQAQGWEDADQAIYLSALLKGDALEVYSRMSQRDANDYDKLKDALLKRYQLTEYGFKRKFYSAKQDKAEASGQFVARLEHYLDRWIEMTGIDHTYGALKDLLVLEQYLWKSPRELSTYIREHATKDLDEVAKLAETYLEAHTYPESKKTANKGTVSS